MFKIFKSVFLFSLIFVSQVNSSEIIDENSVYKMPSAPIIRELVNNDYFLEKTQYDTKLEGRELYPQGVRVDLELSLYDFHEYMKKGNPSMANILRVQMKMSTEDLVDRILQKSEKLESAES
jgi:hypothetical protein